MPPATAEALAAGDGFANGTLPAIPPAPLMRGPERGRLDRAWTIVSNRRWVFLGTFLVVVAIALVMSFAGGARYVSTATLVLRQPPAVTDAQPTTDAGEAARETHRELLELPAVRQVAGRAVGLSADEVADDVDVELSGNADVVKVEATANSAGDAAALAEAYARSYLAYRRQLEQANLDSAIERVDRALAQVPAAGAEARALRDERDSLNAQRAVQDANAELAQRPQAPDNAESRNVARNLGAGVVLGLLLGFLLSWVMERLDRRIKTVDDLEETYELPVLARIPRSPNLTKRSVRTGGHDVISKASGFSEEAEAFRTLRANLRYFNVDRQLKSILVASPVPGEGKSTIARFLAMTMAAMGDRVVLVDADMRKRDEMLPTDTRSEGLSLVLAGFDLDEALTEMPISFDPVSEGSRNLVKLSNGPLPPNPSELLESARMRWLLRELENRFDFVIIDSPALVSVSDALALVPEVSGVLIVSGFGQTSRHAAVNLRKQLALLGGNPLGTVANFWKKDGGEDYYYSYGHGTPGAGRSRTRSS